jgi:predicted enzyme related to lactoylglutathione lyase
MAKKKQKAKSSTPLPGSVTWMDLTVPDADPVRDFYAEVAGWRPSPIEMGGYSDYVMTAGEGAGLTAFGVCHARGANAEQPQAWMIYINVPDLDDAVAKVTTHGGHVVRPSVACGGMGRFAIVTDPSGTAVGLFETAKPAESAKKPAKAKKAPAKKTPKKVAKKPAKKLANRATK